MGEQLPRRRRPVPHLRRRVPSAPPAGREAGVNLLLALALTAATFLLYLPILSNGFVEYDDPMYVTRNAMVKQGLSAETIHWACTTTHFANWLPVTWLSHLADVSLFGLNPAGHHATSAVLHAINAALVFLVLRSMTGARWRSFVVAALFAVHPLRVESVAWVAERKDVLSATFFLLTLLAWSRYVHRPRRSSWAWYAAAMVLYALGLMSKTMLVTLPPLLLLLDVWPLRRVRWPRAGGADEPAPVATGEDLPSPPPASTASPGWLLVEKVPLFVLAAVASAWTLVLQRQGNALVGEELWTPGQRLANAAVSVPRYLGKMLWPENLSVFYPHPGTWPAWAVVGSVLLIVALTAGAWVERRRMPYLIIGWLWFLGMLVPVSGIIQAGLQAMADRYTYLASIGLTLAVVWAVADLVRRYPQYPAIAPAAAAVAVFGLCVATWAQEGYWEDTTKLFKHALEADERNYLAHDMVGEQLARKEESSAIEHYRRAIELNPRYTYGYVHLGGSLRRSGHRAEALDAFRQGVRQSPDAAIAHRSLGIGLADAKQYAQADAEFAEAVRLDPSNPEVYTVWGITQEARGRPDAALPLYRKALAIDPDEAGALAGLKRVTRPAPTTLPGTMPSTLPGT